MNIAKTWQTDSSSSANTFAVAEQLGQKCRGGELFLLKSDIGGGKTTFVKGLAKGLGSTDQVGSPTYTINKVYKCANGLELQHFDFYRLNDAGIVAHELAEFIHEPNTVIAIEWGDIVTDTLPKERIEITIERLAASEEARHISINCPQTFSYLLGDVE